MGWKTLTIIGIWLLFIARPAVAQDLGPHFVKIRDGIYVYGRDDIAGRDPTSNCGIIVTQEGVVLIDSGANPPDSLAILKAIKQLTNQPIRFLINTETHNDHTTGDFVFSPPAVVIASKGATAGIKNYYGAKRNEKLMAESAEMRDSFRGFRLVLPHVEFTDRLILNMGGSNFSALAVREDSQRRGHRDLAAERTGALFRRDSGGQTVRLLPSLCDHRKC